MSLCNWYTFWMAPCWKIVEFLKISLKLKNVKHFARPKQWAALMKLCETNPKYIKFYYISGTKDFLWRYTEMYRLCFQSASDVHWNIWTNIKKLYAWNNLFKKTFQTRDFESSIFYSKFHYFRDRFKMF